MAVVLILLGAVLLLPGLCAGAFMVVFGLEEPKTLFDSGLMVVWLPCFAIAAGGILMIRAGRRRIRERREEAGRHDGDTGS